MFKWFMLLVYILLIAYVLWRSIHCIRRIHPVGKRKRVYLTYLLLFVACSLTLLLGGLLPEGTVRTVLRRFSNFWLGFFIYAFFFTVLADILRAVLYLIHRRKKLAIMGTPRGYALMFALVAALSIGFTAYGLVHADRIYTTRYEVTVEKDAGALEDLNVVFIADLHLGYSVGVPDMERMVAAVNALDADVILVGGDIVDNAYEAMEEPEQIAELLRSMKSRYGVYGVYGNHDVAETLIGGFTISPRSEAIRDPRVEEFLADCNITMLEDASTLVADSFYVVGRLDGEKAGDGTDNRMETADLTADLDHSRPILLLAHEPDELEENDAAGADLQLSGHTHNGQFFPLTLTQGFKWKNYYGYLRVGNLQNIVTSGVGIYGPDMRVMTNSEVVQITVHFD